MNGDEPGPDLSVVIPVYDEIDNLRPLVDELTVVLDRLPGEWEVLLVDDGSRDGSGDLIDRISGENPRVRALHIQENTGQTAAFDAGFRAARGRLIVTMDADLQNDPADIALLLDKLEGRDPSGAPDAVIGWRRTRRDSPVRRIASWIGNTVRNMLSGDSVRDTGCSLKAFRAARLKSIRMYDGMHRFLPTLLRMDGGRVEEVPVGHRPRTAGRSKYGISNRALRGFFDVLAVRWMKRRHLDYKVVERTSGRAVSGENEHAG